MIWVLPPFQGPDENRHWKAAVQLYRTDGQSDSILFRLPNILDAESPRWQAETPFHAMSLHAMPGTMERNGDQKGVGYVNTGATPSSAWCRCSSLRSKR